MNWRRGEWSKYKYYPIAGLIFGVSIGGGLRAHILEESGSWMADLIIPLIAVIFLFFITLNFRKFDGRVEGNAPINSNPEEIAIKCAWCNNRCSGDYCSRECEREFTRYKRREGNFAKSFISYCILPLALFLAPVLAGNVHLGAGLLIVGYGAAFILRPVAVPYTIDRVGARHSLRMCDIAGWILLVCGSAIVIYAPPF